MKTAGFPREERLADSAIIRAVFRKGKRYTIEGARIFLSRNNTTKNRILFSFPRGYGNAVKRNFSRRLSREAYRSLKHEIQKGFDLILLVFPGKDEFWMRKKQIEALFTKADLWLEKDE